MTRIVTNNILHPTKRVIENWNRDFRTSDGPNTSSFINLDDIAIPYDSHYVSKVVLPGNSTDFYLNYGTLDSVTFLLIKVTYNYNYSNEDNYDPFYSYEPNNYNINYYFEGYSGKTYPIGRILLLNGSFTNKIEKIYLNNPLDYDVVLDIFHANIENISQPIPISSAITISNLYYSDIITNQVDCTPIWYTTTTTTTIYDSGTTTTTTTIYDSGTTTTTTTVVKEQMKLFITTENDSIYKSGYFRYNSTGGTIGLFDYFKNNNWILDGKSGSFIEFTDVSDVDIIRFYFDDNDKYFGTLKTNNYEPINYNTGMYFIDILSDGTQLNPEDYNNFNNENSNNNENFNNENSGVTQSFTGSTEFIISEYIMILTGYTIDYHYIPYHTINNIIKNDNVKCIYIDTSSEYYTLNFLTTEDFNMSYNRINYIYESYSNGNCGYLTINNIYENNNIIIV